MSAGSRWHEDAPNHNGEPTMPQACVSRIRTLGSEENPALRLEPQSGAHQLPQSTPDDTAEDREILANLLRAIQSTEVAVRMGDAPPHANGHPHPPSFVAPAQITPATSILKSPGPETLSPPSVQPESSAIPLPAFAAPVQQLTPPPPRVAAKAKPAPRLRHQPSSDSASPHPMPRPRAPSRGPGHRATSKPPDALPIASAPIGLPPPPAAAHQLPVPPVRRIAVVPSTTPAHRVQTAPFAESLRLMPPPGTPSRRPVSASPPKPAESPRVAATQQSPSPPHPFTAEPAPAVTLPSLSLSVEVSSPFASTLARASLQTNRLTAKITPAFQRMCRSAIHHSAAACAGILAAAALTVKRMAHAATQLSHALWYWIGTTAMPAAVRTGRAATRLLAAFMTWAAHIAVQAAKRMGLAAIHISAQLKIWFSTKAPVAMAQTRRAASQASTGLRDWADAKPAQIVASMGRTKKQLSAGFKASFGPRRTSRLAGPPLVAWCWTADTPESIKIADISTSGIHLLTDVRWPRGATVSMTLQRTDRPRQTPGSWIVTDFVILRWCKDGLAGAFVPPSHYSASRGTENYADQKTLKRFVKQLALPAHR